MLQIYLPRSLQVKLFENWSAFDEAIGKNTVRPLWLSGQLPAFCIILWKQDDMMITFSALTLLVWCKKLSDELLVRLFVCSEVQMIYTWSSWCHCHPIISCLVKLWNGLTFLVPAYPGCPEKDAIKWVSVLWTQAKHTNPKQTMSLITLFIQRSFASNTCLTLLSECCQTTHFWCYHGFSASVFSLCQHI